MAEPESHQDAERAAVADGAGAARRATGFPRILDVEIDARTPWARKHVASIRQAYARAPFLDATCRSSRSCCSATWERLVDLDLACAALMARWFGLRTRIERSSALGIGGERSERLVNICRHFGASTYVSGDAAAGLSRRRRCSSGTASPSSGSATRIRPIRSSTATFVPYLSALDLLFNCGDEAPLIAFGGIR